MANTVALLQVVTIVTIAQVTVALSTPLFFFFILPLDSVW